MKRMSLIKVVQKNDCQPPSRIDFHISVVFALIRQRFPKLSFFGHKLRLVLSVTPFR